MLKPEQYVAIEWLSQIKHGGKTLEEIAELCGVTRQCLWSWRRDDEFQHELKREIVRNTMSRLPEVLEAMADSAITLKSAAAAKLILQANEIITDKVLIEQKQQRESEVDTEALRAKLEQFKARIAKETPAM
ncbi:phBC6A51 family helix-turn-helix protein [Paenibacillus sp. SI8]|uniref:phBC6A51 family helix-turn-helix protein n=1 Tax=unclassified Paenibacillus TaxID=185978 RepID=UPI0034652E61